MNVTHYDLITPRGVLRVLPEHRPNSPANLREGIIYVVDLDTGEAFPCRLRELYARYAPAVTTMDPMRDDRVYHHVGLTDGSAATAYKHGVFVRRFADGTTRVEEGLPLGEAAARVTRFVHEALAANPSPAPSAKDCHDTDSR